MLRKTHQFATITAGSLILLGCGGGSGSASSPSGGTPSSYTLGGSITGLTVSGLVLANGTSTLTPAASASTFTFSAALASGVSYNVTVQTQPAGEACTVTSGSGAISNSSVTNVAVTCKPQEFAYAAGGNGVYGYSIDFDTGALTEIAGSPFCCSTPFGGSGNLVVHPTGHYLFVANGGNVDVNSINASTGVLTAVSGSPFSAGGQADFVAIDPKGRFLYASAVNSQVWAYTIDGTTGALTPVTGSPFAAGANPTGVTVDSTGQFVYVLNSNSNTISAYAIDQTSGALTPLSGSPFLAGGGTGDCFIAADPHSNFVYVYEYGVVIGQAGLTSYAIDATTGALTAATVRSGFAGGSICGTIAINPSGTSMYATIPNNNLIGGYSVNLTTGALTNAAETPETVPTGSAVDPLGHFLYVAAQNELFEFGIDASTGAIQIASSDDVSAPTAYAVAVAQPQP